MSGLPPDNNVDDVHSFLSDETVETDDKTPDTKQTKSDDKNIDDIDLTETDDDDDRLDLDEDDEDEKTKRKGKGERKVKEKDTEIEDEDEDEDEEDEEAEKEDEEDEIDIEAPPRKRDVTAKYPKFFKEFPWMEKMMYRDKQYTELFGSFDDAKVASHHSSILNTVNQELGNGNIGYIFDAIKKGSDPKVFDKVVDNLLTDLNKVDKQAYVEVTSNIGKYIIKDVWDTANELDDDDPLKAEYKKIAAGLNKFLFNTNKYTPPTKRVTEEKKSETDEIAKERENFIKERYEASKETILTKVDNTLKNAISNYIDPKNELTAFAKKHAINEALTSLHNTLSVKGCDSRSMHVW